MVPNPPFADQLEKCVSLLAERLKGLEDGERTSSAQLERMGEMRLAKRLELQQLAARHRARGGTARERT